MKRSVMLVLTAMWFGFAIASHGAEISAVDLVGYWPLGSNAVNSVAAENHGLVVGSAAFDDSALALSGGYVNFGANSSLSITGSLSCCLWVNPDTNNRLMRILGKFSVSDGNNREYALFLGPDNRLWVFLSDNGTADEAHAIVKATVAPLAGNNEWHQLAVTWDSTLGANGLKVYIDGESKATAVAQGPGITGIHSGTAGLTLGTYDVIGDQITTTNSFEGAVCGFLLCRGALSDLAISDLFALGRNAGPEKVKEIVRLENEGNQNQSDGDGGNSGGRGSHSGRTAPVGRGIIYVDEKHGNDRHSGLAKEFNGEHGPKKTIKAALRIATEGDEISVAEGVYCEGPVEIHGVKFTVNGHVVLHGR